MAPASTQKQNDSVDLAEFILNKGIKKTFDLLETTLGMDSAIDLMVRQ